MKKKSFFIWITVAVFAFVGLFAVANISNLKSGIDTVQTQIAEASNYNLAITTTDKATVSVVDVDNEEVDAGQNKLVPDAVYTVTVTAVDGYTATIKINGISFTSGSSFTANGNTSIVVTTAVAE